MRIAQWQERIEIWAPAKLNLFLEVVSRRPDGYHEVETLMVPINLYDTVRLCRTPGRNNTLSCRVVDGLAWKVADAIAQGPHVELPATPDNLVYRAMQRMHDINPHLFALEASLIKRIPWQAGLGGASSDAAATCRAAVRLGDDHLPPALVSRVASELGSDVPFFLQDRPAWCRGRGERVEPLAGIPPVHAVVVQPPSGLSTAQVYQAAEVPVRPHDGAPLVAALRQGNIPAAGKLLFNRLQLAAAQGSPWIDRLRGIFQRLDLLGHQMSGSGSSYFGLCRSRRHAQRIAAQLRAMRVGSVMAVETLSADPP